MTGKSRGLNAELAVSSQAFAASSHQSCYPRGDVVRREYGGGLPAGAGPGLAMRSRAPVWPWGFDLKGRARCLEHTGQITRCNVVLLWLRLRPLPAHVGWPDKDNMASGGLRWHHGSP
jgi:hypothetical protein